MVPDSIIDDPDGILVRVVQVYLQRRLQAEAPGALLTLYWEDFFRIYGPLVSALVARHVERHERDDLVQEIWMTVAAKLPDFQWTENRGGLRAWLTTLIRRRTIDLIRQRDRRREIGTAAAALPEGEQEPVDAQADPTARLEQEWQAQAVHTVLESLRPEIGDLNQQIVHLHYWGGHSVSEIAALVQLSAPQVSARLHRVLEKLRCRMSAYFGGD
jgi:RNA polymerase sigma-70 factor (ECF subfamily)